jgi:hypothetical protein
MIGSVTVERALLGKPAVATRTRAGDLRSHLVARSETDHNL